MNDAFPTIRVTVLNGITGERSELTGDEFIELIKNNELENT